MLFKEKKVGKTVYLPQWMWDMIEAKAQLQTRNRSQEIEHTYGLYLESQKIKAQQSGLNQTQQQCTASGDPSSNPSA